MKQAEREKYLNVAGAMGCGLCICCKYSKGEGSLCDGEAYSECHHTLEKIQEADEDGEISCGAKDCWAFRPQISFEDLVTIVSYVLEYGWDEWQYDINKKKNSIRIQKLKQKVIFQLEGK